MKQKFLRSLIIITAVIFSLSSCSSKDNGSSTPAEEKKNQEADFVDLSEEQFKTVNIQYGKIEDKNLSSVIRSSGRIEAPPQQLVTVSSPYGGVVKNIPVLEGKFVSQGQIVAVLENPEFIQLQQDYLDYKSQLSFVKEELDRQQELAKENVNAKKTLQKATSEFNSMVARVQGLSSKLRLININPDKIESSNISSRTNVYASSSGYVTKVNVNIGKYVNANEALAEIADTRELHVELTVFEKDVPKIKAGQKVRFVLNNETKERIAEVSLVGREIGTDRTVRVHCRLLKEDRELLPGLFLKGIIETGVATTTALPDKAIVQSAGRSYIFIAEDEKKGEPNNANASKNDSAEKHIAFKRMEVTTGVSENGYTEVILPENLERENRIVISGAYDLLSKMNNVEEDE